MDKRINQGKEQAKKIIKVFNESIFTPKQYRCLKLRASGCSLQSIANELGTTRQDISLAIINATKKAHKQIK